MIFKDILEKIMIMFNIKNRNNINLIGNNKLKINHKNEKLN